ncbi:MULTISPECIES: AI-2E family transporter [Anaerolinea]|uniref:AI-2E family transporter n=1 Tax=Anaerolinea TaxID=233189 RepID=UPI002639A6CE|nr:AI-2E family transporter [Anaerolinea thermophila]
MSRTAFTGPKLRKKNRRFRPARYRAAINRWDSTTKLVVSLALFSVAAWLLVRFRNIVGPLLLAVLLAYLLYPVVSRLQKATRMSWRLAVGIVYIFLVLLVLGGTTLSGLAVVEQSQSLIRFLQQTLKDLPSLLVTWSEMPIQVGPFQLVLPNFMDVNTLTQSLLGIVQPLLSRAGTLVGSIASGAVNFLGWVFFILLISYFILAESGGASPEIIRINLPGYNEDLRKFGTYLSGIWNAFLRGQIIIILITVLVYTVLLGILGLRFFIGLALLAGLARFVPYVGPAVAWTSYGLVALFQGSNYFGLPPWGYVILVVGIAWITDIVLDNLVATRLMGTALKIHPAAVMVSALVGANLFGIIGVVLAAPVVATLKLLISYIIYRLSDQEPWESLQVAAPVVSRPIFSRIRSIMYRAFQMLRKGIKKYGKPIGTQN